jgi:hypothetical protein
MKQPKEVIGGFFKVSKDVSVNKNVINADEP